MLSTALALVGVAKAAGAHVLTITAEPQARFQRCRAKFLCFQRG
jgi:hypothetical protein